MSNVEKLKKKAAEFEQKKQFDRALETYVQIIEHTKGSEDKDVAVYNRVGDLNLRLNKVDQAVHYYEQAVDLYTEGGYLNNAIALCNKILRHAPKRNQIYYKLGKISAKKGFNSDAKKNFLEYADRMHKAGRDTDAFKALEEFADLCPGQDDIRLMLAEQLAKAGKNEEAVEQLQILHESLDAEGRTGEAAAAVKRMHMLDPTVVPRKSDTPRSAEQSGLVFLDTGHSPSKPQPRISGLQPTSMAPEKPRRPKTPPHKQPAPEIEQLSYVELETPTAEEPGLGEEVPGLEIIGLQTSGMDVSGLDVPGLETGLSELETDLADPDAEPTVAEMDAAFDEMIGDLELEPLEGLESNATDDTFDLTVDEPPADSPTEGLTGSSAEEVVSDPLVGMDPRSVESPFDSADPLAGLSVLEDDRFYDDNPLAGARSTLAHTGFAHDAPTPTPAAPRKAAKVEEPEEVEELEEEEADPVDIAALGHEEADEAEEDDSVSADALTVDEDEDAPAPAKRQLTRPKLVEDKSRRAATPKRGSRQKTPPEASGSDKSRAERKPLNPFKRNAQSKKPPAPVGRSEKSKPATPRKNAPHAPYSSNKGGGDTDFVDLADWLRQDSAPRSTRMVAKDDKRIGDEQADFTDMLEKFKAGVAANVDDEDFDSHYDLGIAYREMGLIDEAVAEFQKALRGATHRIRAYEALGQCFIDRGEHDVAITVLSRSLREPGLEDDDLIGVLYLLGYAAEESGQARDAAAYYQRVFAIDIDFRDVGERLKKMSKAAGQ
jgi:tetratricopeptide (TPR) repeat protein